MTLSWVQEKGLHLQHLVEKTEGFWVSLIFEEEALPPETAGFEKLFSVNGVSEGEYNSLVAKTGA